MSRSSAMDPVLAFRRFSCNNQNSSCIIRVQRRLEEMDRGKRGAKKRSPAARARTGVGPGIREGIVFDRAMESIDLVPTLGAMLGFSPSLARGEPIAELL